MKYKICVNEIGLIPKLVTLPYEKVWEDLCKLGVSSVEVCAIPYHSERIREYVEEAAKKYPVGMPECLARGKRIFELVDSVRNGGLEVYSCHLLQCEAYPELIEESLPYLKEVGKKAQIGQFVISCMFDSASKTEAFIPHIQKAAKELKEEGITLCYHNHHMDSMPLENGKTAMEMVIENCPDCMIQLDVGWAWYGNMDSLQFMKEHGNRIVSLHLKDLTADSRAREDDGKFTAIGAGAAPIAEAIRNLHLCRTEPDRLIFDQDASVGDIYEDIAFGIRFVSGI